MPTTATSPTATSPTATPITPARRSVLITGAHGRLGQAVARAFAGAGWQVLAQVRRTEPALPGCVMLSTPLADTGALAAAAAGAQVVVHAANPAYTAWTRDLLPLARLGMDIAEHLGAHLLMPGNVYNYGHDMPARLAEDTPMHPDTRKGRLRRDLETELTTRTVAGRLHATLLRAGDFYGCAQGTWLDLMMLKNLRRGRVVYPGPLDRVHAWAYLPDLAQAFVAAAEQPATGYSRWHVPGHAVTGAQFVAALERVAPDCGVPLPANGLTVRGVPWPLLRLGGLVVPMLRELAEMAYLWTAPHALDGARWKAAFPSHASTPFDDALRATVRTILTAQAPAASGTAQPV